VPFFCSRSLEKGRSGAFIDDGEETSPMKKVNTNYGPLPLFAMELNYKESLIDDQFIEDLYSDPWLNFFFDDFFVDGLQICYGLRILMGVKTKKAKGRMTKWLYTNCSRIIITKGRTEMGVKMGQFWG
nr:hypothetical protein [Tanacetum cinerariifolium]